MVIFVLISNIFCFIKYQNVTHVSTCIFQSVALVTKKLWAILVFFTDRTFFPPCTLTYKFFKKYFFNKKSFKLLSLITVIVSKIRVLGQKLKGAPNAPPPASLRLKGIENKMKYYDISETCSVFILASFKSLPVGHLPNSTLRTASYKR